MPVTLTITADTLAEALAQFGNVPLPGGPPPFSGEAMALREAPAVEQDGPAAPATETAAEGARRGRPRKNTPTAEAAQPPAAYTVRRFDGQTDDDFTDSGVATNRLVELVHNAADPEALDALVKANAGLVAALPAERREEVNDALARARAALAPKTETPATPRPAMAWKDIDQNPLTVVTADRRGALNVVRAIAAGPAPQFGFNVAKAMVERSGVDRVSARPGGAHPQRKEEAPWICTAASFATVAT